MNSEEEETLDLIGIAVVDRGMAKGGGGGVV